MHKLTIITLFLALMLVSTAIADDSKLSIIDLKTYVNGNKDTDANEDGGTIRDVEVGSTLKFIIKVENLFTDDEDIDIRELIITVTIQDIDDGDDIEVESNEFKVYAEEKESQTIEVMLPLEIRENNYVVIIEAEGEDENGSTQSDTVELEIEIDKQTHELIFDKIQLMPNSIICGQSTQLSYELYDIGTNDEDGKLTVQSDQIDLIYEREFELTSEVYDNENKLSEQIMINVPANIKGTIPIFLRAKYGPYFIEDKVELLIVDCPGLGQESDVQAVENQQPAQETNTQTQPEIVQAPVYKSTQPVYTASSKAKTTESIDFGTMLIALLLIGVFFLTIVFVVMYKK